MTSGTSFEAHDPAWAEFVERARAHYMQGAQWADFKRAFDWTIARVTVRQGRDVAAGAQVLLRRVPVIGAVAWAPKARSWPSPIPS